jgi:hypothetical protein
VAQRPKPPTHLLGEQGAYTVTSLDYRKGHYFAVGFSRCCGQPFERRADRMRLDPVCWRCARRGAKRGPYVDPEAPWPTPETELLRHWAITSKPFGAIKALDVVG